MSNSVRIVTYELYTLEYSGWVLHARYPSSDRDEALSEAKTIETTLERATKLVRETYTPDTNHYEEAVVRISPDLVEFKKKLRKHKRAAAQAGSGAAHDPFAQYAPDADSKPQLKPRQVITGVTMMTLSALVIAAGVTAIASLLLKTNVLGQHVAKHNIPPVLFGTFLVVFLLAALPLVSRYIPNFGGKSGDLPDDFFIDMQEDNPSPDLRDRPQDADRNAQDGPPALFVNDPGLLEKEPEINIAIPVDAPPPAPNPPAAPEKTKPPENKPKPSAATEETASTEAEDDAISSVPDKQRMSMMRYLTGVITILKDVCPQLDTYNKFGLNLIMAGACSNLGQRTDLNETQILDLTQEAITLLGGRQALAADFCRKLDGYMADTRYADMYRAGYEAFTAFADQPDYAFDDVANAMRSWNRPSDRITGAKILTIMFTDIVSSTLITYKRGDDAAQTYIRCHNAIVRQALAQFNGEEVKHTGDGIMACFQTPADAIEAAVAIQRAVAAHNAEHPTEEFQLRIGLNTGEPIREDNDLFGSSVQLASRTCDQSGPGQIFISNVVNELIADRGYPITMQPPRKLKGIKEAQIFHSVQWADFPATVAIHSPTLDADNTQLPTEPPPAAPVTDGTVSAVTSATVDHAPDQAVVAPSASRLTSDQVLNAAQQVALSDEAKTEDAKTIIKK